MGKNPQQIMARKYNYIFRQLVKDKNDICGHIAYSIYKFDKVSYLDTFKKENGREPNEEEMNTFHNSCCTPARIEEYKHHAQSILGMFSNEVLRAAANQIENDYIRNQEGTSVFLMGLNRLPQIMERLVQTGAEEHTPVTVISKGTMPGQRIVRGDIQTIADKVNEAKLESPAIIVVGENAALDFTAPNRGPLQNVHVGLIGTPKLREKMRVAIDALGGQSYSIVDMSVEQTEEKNRLRVALEHIEDYSWLAFTSQNTITLFFKWLREWNIDVRKLAHLKLAVVGAGTRDALKVEGYIADYVPDEYTTSALAMGLANVMNDGEKLLLPRAVQGSETMLDILDQGGVVYEEIPVYDVVGRRMESIQYLKDLDVITFVSASGVRGFLDVLDAEKKNCGVAHLLNDIDSCGDHTDNTDGSFKIHDIMKNIRIAALGNVTEKALEKAGYHADIVPEVGDIEHLISAIGDYYFREKRQ